jgi:hypothetical protein
VMFETDDLGTAVKFDTFDDRHASIVIIVK